MMSDGNIQPAASAAPGDDTAPLADVAGATAKRAELISDAGFRGRYLSGDIEARNEMAALNAQIATAQSAETNVADAFTLERAREMGCSPEVLEQIKKNQPVTLDEKERVAVWKRGRMSDKGWVEKFNGGDLQARREMFLANLVLSSPVKQPAA